MREQQIILKQYGRQLLEDRRQHNAWTGINVKTQKPHDPGLAGRRCGVTDGRV